MIIYIIFIVSFILGYISQRTNNKIFLFLNILLLSVFVGFRSSEVGIDTQVYADQLYNLSNGFISDNVEIGYMALSYIILKMFGSPEYVFFIISLITNTCILGRLWTFRKRIPFTIMILIYLILYYPETCNIMRQYLAVSVIFLSTILLEKRRYLSYGIISLLMMTIHTSAIISFALIPIHILFSHDISSKIKQRTLVLLLLLFPLILYFINIISTRYSEYLESSNNSFGFLQIIRLLFFFISAYLSKIFYSSNIEGKNIYKLEDRIIGVYYFCGIILSFLGYYVTSLLRVGLIFNLFEIIFIPLVCYKRRRGYQISRALYTVYLLFMLIKQISGGWSGLSDYSWIF